MRDPLRKNEVNSASKSALAGGLSGLITRTVVSPIDVLKIRLQVTPNAQLRHLIWELWEVEGLRGLWKGNVPGSIMYVLYGSVQFCSYGVYNKWLSPLDWNDGVHGLVVGGLAGSTGAVVSYPFDTLRTRFVASRSVRLQTLYRSVATVWVREGPRGFFYGCSTSVLGIASSTAVTFGCYESLRVWTEKRKGRRENGPLALWYGALYHGASLVSAVVAKLVTFPLDTLRKRAQLPAIPQQTPSTPRAALLQLGRAMWQQEGIRSFYRGLLLSLCKAVPSTVVSLWCFQIFMDWKNFCKIDSPPFRKN